MDRSILNKYKNPEEKLILSKILDKISFCISKNQIQVSDFLNLAEQDLIIKFLKLQREENYMLYGAFEEAERKVIIFYPEKFKTLIEENKINFNEWLKVIKITLPNENKGKFEHKNYLGALMKLGIKREKVGDIIVDDNGADIIVLKEILEFLLLNLKDLTRFQKSQIEEIHFNDLRKIDIKKEQIKITVSSMRLDNIISELARCSRSKALEYLMQERVFVNYENITKQTKEVKQGDKITIRGKGRFEIKSIIGNTKKGRIIVEIEK